MISPKAKRLLNEFHRDLGVCVDDCDRLLAETAPEAPAQETFTQWKETFQKMQGAIETHLKKKA